MSLVHFIFSFSRRGKRSLINFFTSLRLNILPKELALVKVYAFMEIIIFHRQMEVL